MTMTSIDCVWLNCSKTAQKNYSKEPLKKLLNRTAQKNSSSMYCTQVGRELQ